MPNARRKPTQDKSDEGITVPVDPETALVAASKATVDDDGVQPIDLADLPGLRTTAEWDRLSNEEIEALGDGDDPTPVRPPKKSPAERTLPKP